MEANLLPLTRSHASSSNARRVPHLLINETAPATIPTLCSYTMFRGPPPSLMKTDDVREKLLGGGGGF